MTECKVVREVFDIAANSLAQCRAVILCILALAAGEAASSDFSKRYILKHYPYSHLNRLRAYSCGELHAMCDWVSFKDAVLDKNCEGIYPKDTKRREACLDVIMRDDIYIRKLKNCEKDRSSKYCLKDRRYKYSCDGIYNEETKRSVCKDIMNVFSYCESIIYYNYEEDFPACHKVIRDRKAFSKTGCKATYGSAAGPTVHYGCMDLFDDGRASGSRRKKGLHAAYKVFCKDITRRNEVEMEIFSREFSCKMQTFWRSEDGTLCESRYENACFSKAANVW